MRWCTLDSVSVMLWLLVGALLVAILAGHWPPTQPRVAGPMNCFPRGTAGVEGFTNCPDLRNEGFRDV